jgi:deoxyribodipyrimidine photo-lyase
MKLEPTLEAAHARIRAVNPTLYARTRNALEGSVSGLSPYITHGYVSLREVLAGVYARHPLDVQHKFVYELGWREYFRHVWKHHGERIFSSLHEGILPDESYSPEVPGDVQHAVTGIPAIDCAVRTLYETGYLHNHARMWLASYLVHLRKVHWRAGADWLYSHLLDGDLASNHLSWQWVAGTGSHKPYLFNAENVARYAPTPWHSEGTAIDTSYEALEHIARSDRPLPTLLSAAHAGPEIAEPEKLRAAPPWLGSTTPDPETVFGRDVWIVHPWSLGPLPADLSQNSVVVGLCIQEFHHDWPWTERRWRFVGERMRKITSLIWWADLNSVRKALEGASSARCTADPHLPAALASFVGYMQAPSLFPDVESPCRSFSQWWHRATRDVRDTSSLLAD